MCPKMMKQKMKYFAVYWIQKRLIHEFVYSFQAVGGRGLHMRLSRNFIIDVYSLQYVYCCLIRIPPVTCEKSASSLSFKPEEI
jgi:hypothetical protein